MSTPSPRSASIAPEQRCRVASSIAAALTASRNPPSPSLSPLSREALSPGRGSPICDASLRSRASPRREAWREGLRFAATAPSAGGWDPDPDPDPSASPSAAGDSGSSDKPPRRDTPPRVERDLLVTPCALPLETASEEALDSKRVLPVEPFDRREDPRSDPSTSSSSAPPSSARSMPRISRMGLAYRPSRSRSSPQPSSRATTAALRSREVASGENPRSWWNSRWNDARANEPLLRMAAPPPPRGSRRIASSTACAPRVRRSHMRRASGRSSTAAAARVFPARAGPSRNNKRGAIASCASAMTRFAARSVVSCATSGGGAGSFPWRSHSKRRVSAVATDAEASDRAASAP